MNNPISLLYPIINVIVTALFAGMVIRQYLQRHRPYQLYWAIALLMAFLATVAYVLMVLVQPTSDAGTFFFRSYYILGAALMPAWLGLGSVALVADKRFTRVTLMVLITLSIFAIVFLSIAVIDASKLSQIVGTAGAGVFVPAEWLGMIIILNTLGVVEVVGVAIYSGIQVLRRRSSIHLFWANMLILAGDLINAAAGSSARLGLGLAFWLVMAIGWTVFFLGVLLASQRRSHAIASPKMKATRAIIPEPYKAETHNDSKITRDFNIPTQAKSTVETQVETQVDNGIETSVENRVEHRIETRIENGVETRIETRIETHTEIRIERRVSSKALNSAQV